MCGIFGYVGKPLHPALMKVLFMYNDSRGGHACGYYSDVTGIVKDSEDAKRFLSENPIPRGANLFLGHTRYGTIGKNNKDNAHPFQKGEIIGVHNGCLSDYYSLSKKYDFDFCVDSEVIFEMLNRKDIEGLKEVHGSMAIAWTDSTGNLRLYRRDNPIYFGYIGKTFVFSSLEESLKAIGVEKVDPLLANHVWTLDQTASVQGGIKLDYTKPKEVYVRNWDDGHSKRDSNFYNEHRWDSVKRDWVKLSKKEIKKRNTRYAHAWDEDIDFPQKPTESTTAIPRTSISVTTPYINNGYMICPKCNVLARFSDEPTWKDFCERHSKAGACEPSRFVQNVQKSEPKALSSGTKKERTKELDSLLGDLYDYFTQIAIKSNTEAALEARIIELI